MFYCTEFESFKNVSVLSHVSSEKQTKFSEFYLKVSKNCYNTFARFDLINVMVKHYLETVQPCFQEQFQVRRNISRQQDKRHLTFDLLPNRVLLHLSTQPLQ